MSLLRKIDILNNIMNRRYGTLALAIAILSSCGGDREHVKPQLSDITHSVYASGNVKAKDQYQVFSTVNGIVKRIAVDEGDTVSIGDTLFIVDDRVSELNTENAELALELSKKNAGANSDRLQELKDNIGIAKEKLAQDSSLYFRQKNLWDQGIGSKLDLEQRKLAYDNSSATYKTAVNRYQQVLDEVSTNYKQAKNNAELNQKLLGDHTILSELKGKVYSINMEQGELVSPQTPLGIVGDANDFEIDLQVDENDIVQVEAGQKALITMDSYDGQVFEATVTKIYPILNDRSRTFKVTCKFVDRPDVMYPNLTVEGNIVVDSAKNVLVIPRDYLVDNKYVLLKNGDKVEIGVGLMDYRYVEVTSGIDTTTSIYKPE